ncbi:hypothetical protein P9112_011782 [Eukaryota sp. TZLM1-RC]
MVDISRAAQSDPQFTSQSIHGCLRPLSLTTFAKKARTQSCEQVETSKALSHKYPLFQRGCAAFKDDTDVLCLLVNVMSDDTLLHLQDFVNKVKVPMQVKRFQGPAWPNVAEEQKLVLACGSADNIAVYAPTIYLLCYREER